MESKISCRGLRGEYATADHKLWEWYCMMKHKDKTLVTRSRVQNEARKIFQDAGITNFKASDGWYRRWIQRCKKLKTLYTAVSQRNNNTNVNAPGDNSTMQTNATEKNSEENSYASDLAELEKDLITLNQIASPSRAAATMSRYFENNADTSFTSLPAPPKIKKPNYEKLRLKHSKKGERYLPQFKEKVLAYAETHSIKETAKKFIVNSGTIASWRNDKHSVYPKTETEVGSCDSHDSQFIAALQECVLSGKDITSEVVKDIARTNLSAYKHERKCWITRWFERWSANTKNTSHIHYPLNFKLEVAKFSKNSNQMTASRVFGVSRKCVFEWLKLLDTPPSSSNKTSTKLVTDAAVDQKIWNWFQLRCKKPSGKQIRTKATQLYKEKGHLNIKCSYGWYRRWCHRYNVPVRHVGDELLLQWTLVRLEQGHSVTHTDLREQALKLLANKKHIGFRASPGWAIRFCRRYPQLLQQLPDINTNLPAELNKQVEEFCLQITDLITQGSPLLTVGCMDEVHFTFCSSLPMTGKRRELIRKSDVENCHATVLLSCLAEGILLPPMVILKGSDVEGSYPDFEGDICITYHNKGVVDVRIMQQWLHHVWFKFVKTPSILVVDCYDPHTDATVKQLCESQDCQLVVIPGGCSSKLHPIRVTMRKQFQDVVEEQWRSGSVFSWDGPTRPQLPGREKIINWVTAAYNSLQSTAYETIQESFKMTGLITSDHLNDINNFISQLVS